jgi:general stress protein CsbA
MAKLTAWVVTILGLVLILAALGVFSITDTWFLWILSIGVLIVGIGKLVRNYRKKGKR